MSPAPSTQPREFVDKSTLWTPLPLSPDIPPPNMMNGQPQAAKMQSLNALATTPPSDTDLSNGFIRPSDIASAGKIPPHLNGTKPPSTLEASTLLTRSNTPPNEPQTSVQIAAPGEITPYSPASTRLRHMIKYSPTIIDCPGVYDGLSARIALETGFPGLYMTGAGTTASRLGMPDLGIAQLHDMRTNAEMIANLVPQGAGAPLIADMDTGYGGPIVIANAVTQYTRAGVAGFHIEDQILQKRCGHLAGKEVVDIPTYIQRIKACKQTAERIRSDIVIIARTDALQSRGYEECVQRLRLARDAGADVGILEGVQSKEQAAQAVRDLAPWPLCYNSVENGVSPLISTREAQEMGYRLIIFSFAAIGSAYVAVRRTMDWLKKYGATGSRINPKNIFDVCGLKEMVEIDENAGGAAFVNGKI